MYTNFTFSANYAVKIFLELVWFLELVFVIASGLVKMGRGAVGARPKPGERSSDLL